MKKRWDLQFAMWVVVHNAHLSSLEAALQERCDELRDHLLIGGYQLRNPDVQVSVD